MTGHSTARMRQVLIAVAAVLATSLTWCAVVGALLACGLFLPVSPAVAAVLRALAHAAPVLAAQLWPLAVSATVTLLATATIFGAAWYSSKRERSARHA